MLIIYTITFFLMFIPIALFQRYVLNADFETIVVTTIFITGFSVVASVEKSILKSFKIIAQNINRIKRK